MNNRNMFYKTKKNTSGYETDIDFYELEKALSVTKSKKKKKMTRNLFGLR